VLPLDVQLLPGDRVLIAEHDGGRVSLRSKTGEGLWERKLLQPLVALRSERFLDVPEPRRTVLEEAISQARAIRILVRDPG